MTPRTRSAAAILAAALALTACSNGDTPEVVDDVETTPSDAATSTDAETDGDATDAPEAARPELQDGWRWLETTGAAIGVPEEFVDDSADAAADPEAPLVAASLPDAFVHTLSIDVLQVFDPVRGTTVPVATVDDYVAFLALEFASDPYLSEAFDGPPVAEAFGTTATGQAVQRIGLPSDDAPTEQLLVELPQGGVAAFSRTVYIEDMATDVAGIDLADYAATIVLDPESFPFPTDPAGEPWTAPISTDTPIGIRGIGPIAAGMTLYEVERVTGQQVEVFEADTFGGYCYLAEVGGVETLSLLIETSTPLEDPMLGPVGRVSTYEPPIVTRSGVGVGSTADEVRAAYGDALEESGHAYVDGLYLDLFGRTTDEGFGVRFETDESGTVTAVHAGDANVIQYIEGCA